MSKHKALLELAKKTVETEGNAILNMVNQLDGQFADAVDCIYKAEGRVVITGVGKSAIIASKIVATLNSTGTPAIFMHAADAIHGDLGTIQQKDVVICISKSGNTPEIKLLVPLIRSGGNKLVAITGNTESYLAEKSDFVLNTYVEKEACPNNLAPTTSTTAQLVMGDALAICLLELRGFSSRDFAKFHPGGTLGKKLYLRVSDISSQNMVPKVEAHSPVKEVIVEISEKMLGVAAVLSGGKLVGVVTDGDIRRMLNKYENINGLTAEDIMSRHPKTIEPDVLAVKALKEMQTNEISQLLVEKDGKYLGVVHLHNLINEGIL
ncbi:SIS domain-containing protein [Muriicola sp.]|uniref:KpsF/GutQ family sugar-phosphate isomerase n=1 Tax=Muriicola sp. TaxID=2020856 RepID=UPI00356667B8